MAKLKKVNIKIVEAYLDESPEDIAEEERIEDERIENNRLIDESITKLETMLDKADQTLIDGKAEMVSIHAAQDLAQAAHDALGK